MQCAHFCNPFVILRNGTQKYTKILHIEKDVSKYGLLEFWRIFMYTNEYFAEIHQGFLIFISKSTSICIHATFTHPKEEKNLRIDCHCHTCVNIMLFGTLFLSLSITACFTKWFEIVFKQCETYLETQCVRMAMSCDIEYQFMWFINVASLCLTIWQALKNSTQTA